MPGRPLGSQSAAEVITIKMLNAKVCITLTISSKGSLTIPAGLRKKYNLNPGQAVHVVDYSGMLALVPALADPIRESAGLLHNQQDSLTEALLAEHAREAGQ